MHAPRALRPLAVALVLGGALLTGCGGGGDADPASVERLDALNARIDQLEDRVAELQDAADAAADAAADSEADTGDGG